MINLLRAVVAQLENREQPITKAQMSKALGKSRSYIYNLVEKGASDEILTNAVNTLIAKLCYRTDMEAITAELSKQLSAEKKQSYIYDAELVKKNDIISTYEKSLKAQKRQYDQAIDSYNVSVQQRKGLEEENSLLHVEIKAFETSKEILKNCVNKKEDALLKEIEKHKEANERIGTLISEIGTLKFQIERQKKAIDDISEAEISTANALNHVRKSRDLWFYVSLLCVIASLFGFFYHAV